MERNTLDIELGRRNFIRSAALLGTGVGVSVLTGACSDSGSGNPLLSPSEDVVVGRTWVQTESFDVKTGVFTSLSCFTDSTDGVFTSDVQLSGYEIKASGEIVPLSTTVAADDFNSLSLVSVGEGLYRLKQNGIPQPPGAPYEIHLVERTISGTGIRVLTGHSLDPTNGERVSFTVTTNGAQSSTATQSRTMAFGQTTINIWEWIVKLVKHLLRDRRHDSGGITIG